MEAYTQDTGSRRAAEDRDEREYHRLVSDLRWMLKRRHVADYRSDIAELVAELREFYEQRTDSYSNRATANTPRIYLLE